MCHGSCLLFIISKLYQDEIEGKRVIEVGSRYINGSARELICAMKPELYIGIDIEKGTFVDIMLPVHRAVEYFGEESFDLVVCTEVIEHILDWRAAISNMKRLLKSGGVIAITTRSIPFPKHDYPDDFWRYNLEDMERIFSDFEIECLESDPQAPGVFLKAIKPQNFVECDLSNIELDAVT